MNNKAVSEVVGYIFVFGIVVTTVAYAYVNVSTIIKDMYGQYRSRGLRESFKRIQNVFFLSSYGGAPVQTLQTEMQNGMLYVSTNPSIKLKVDSAEILNGAIGSIGFNYGDYKIAIENGAVFEDYYSYRRTVTDPRIFIQQVEVQALPEPMRRWLLSLFTE